MKQKKAGRISQRQREKRRYPFNESTKLIELVDKKHYGDVVKLTERLKPYLTDGEKGAFSLTGLFFDLEAVSGQRQFIINELALFLKKVKAVMALKVTTEQQVDLSGSRVMKTPSTTKKTTSPAA